MRSDRKCRLVTVSRMPASSVSAYFPSPGREGVNCVALNRTPGNPAACSAASTRVVSSHGAPTCSTGASDPRPTDRFVPSNRQSPG